jgi:hypothetical protein
LFEASLLGLVLICDITDGEIFLEFSKFCIKSSF